MYIKSAFRISPYLLYLSILNRVLKLVHNQQNQNFINKLAPLTSSKQTHVSLPQKHTRVSGGWVCHLYLIPEYHLH